MTQIGYVCKYCNLTVLEEKIELLEDIGIIAKNKEIDEFNKKEAIEREAQKKELIEISEKLKSLHKNKYKKYDLEITNNGCSLHTGKEWHVFTLDEVDRFKTYTQLYTVTDLHGRRTAYFHLNNHSRKQEESRYVICPLCKTKNYLPLNQMCLR